MPLGTILATAWTSGLSLYATALLLGLAGRIGWVDVPTALTDPATLIVLAVCTVVEFVADKVPWLDSIWDTIHLFIRPVGAGALSAMLADGTASTQIALAVVGGGFALSSHGAKSSTRALANTSPEPVSNIVLSLVEDGIVVAMVALAVAYPVVAGVAAVILMFACIVAIVVVIRLLRRARSRLAARRAARCPGG